MFAHNRDDHTRNFAFIMDGRGQWQPSPAYDLTFSHGPGGEHTMLIAGEGRNPGIEHLLRLAKEVDLRHASAIIDEVRTAVARFTQFAQQAEVSARLARRVAEVLEL